MRKQSARFIKNFFGALGHCVLQEVDISDVLGEAPGGLEGVVVGIMGILFSIALACLVYGFFQVGYELMFDPNATDVAARLAAISISPEKRV
jgi:hypothetical protein